MNSYTFAYLKSDFEKKMTAFTEVMAAFPWEDKECYAKWLAHSYYYVSHSTRLLAMAASRCDVSEQMLHKRFLEHLQEEKGHEKMALTDLEKIGFDIGAFREMTETSLFYQNQYYWLSYHGAVPFFGWILALEGGAVHCCEKAYVRVAKAHGEKAGIFLKVHAGEDVKHLEQALSQIEHLPSPVLQQIAKNFEQSCDLYWSVLNRIAVEKQKGSGKTKAA